MRGIATVIVVGFISIILFGLVAPAIVEPIVEVFLDSAAVQGFGGIDANAYADSMLMSLLVWAPLIVMGSGVASAVVWYLRRERRSARRIR